MAQDINWKSVGEEAARVLSDYIKIDTTNPPGNEKQAAQFLADVLKKEGFEPELLHFNDTRSNLVCRLKGVDSGKPLLLLSHIDVVGAVAKDWKVAPFSGVIKDGCVWGRGAVDCKGPGVMELMAFITLKRAGVVPKRDIILLANADEEAWGDAGARWTVDNHWDKVRCAFVLNEGGMGLSDQFGKRVMMPCFGEKGPLWIRLRARGKSGHGSMPTPDNPNNKLVAALARVAAYNTRIKLLPEVKDVLLKIGNNMGFPTSLLVRLAANNFVLNLFGKRLVGTKKLNAIMRNTISITNLKAGFKENVIPSESEAILDCRLLPGEDETRFIDELKDVIAMPDVAIEVIRYSAPSQSPTDNEFMRALERVVAKNNPDALFLPILSSGFTDSRFFREKGAEAYGLIPCLFSEEEIGTMHGIDERISIKCLEDGIRNVFDLCREF